VQEPVQQSIRLMKHFTITFQPQGRHISIHSGVTLLEAAGQAGIILNAVCGGRGICRKCMVKIEPACREVLACQYQINENLTVTIPPESTFDGQKILESGIESPLESSAAINEKYRRVAAQDEIFGVAVDIGTTTVVAKLIDLKNGQCLAANSILNPQTQFGSDVISRITYAQTGENSARLLQKTIVDCINSLIAGLCKTASITSDQIYELCAVGNTAMNHIFLGLPLESLGQAPYQAYCLNACDLPPEALGIKINSKGNIHTVENIAGFVGSDTTAVALAAGIDSQEKMTLIVDIGTNGEIVLGNKERLYAASCAAGPALEGARIYCGSTATRGAIEAVLVAGDDIVIDVIGGAAGRSICGSGIIDAVAVMLDLGVINSTGRFAEPKTLEGKLPDAIFTRIFKKDQEPAFKLTEKVFITQSDIRQVQLAKAAIRAGIMLLQKEINLAEDDIEQVLLAGAFGNYIRKESALRIGLLPAVLPEKIHFIGNAAASGAQMILISEKSRQRANKLARQVKYIEIAQKKDFTDTFTKCMAF
jgi:uncharacterized 2Fe-2S/4Fe-4S cluster protein (DUF4445 family)